MNTEQNISSSSSTFAVMTLEYVETASLKHPSRRLRRHSESKLRRLAKFMKKSRVITPLVVDQNNFVILGNARLAALKILGVDTVPVIRVTHLDGPMIRALILADNQFTLNADWYEEALREELLYLAPLLPEIGLELIDLGFETPQLDLIIGDADANDEEELGPDPAVPPVVQPGQLWLLGPHKLFCGDAREEISYISLMGAERAAMIFGDLPYNVPIDGHVCGNGAHQHKEFVMGAGEMSPEQFISFMREIFVLLRRFSKEGSVHMQCMDWRHSLEILTAAQQAGYDYLNMACWVKHAGGMGSLYRSQHELVHIFKSGAGSHINNVMLGKFGRSRIVESWDTAIKGGSKNDFSVCTTWMVFNDEYFLLDILRVQLGYPDLKKLVYEHAAKYPLVEIVIEDAGSGSILYEELRLNPGFTMDYVTAIRPDKDKTTRAAAVSVHIEAGKVWLPREAPWLKGFYHELVQFPGGRNDDQIDSLVQFLRYEAGEKGNTRLVDIGGV